MATACLSNLENATDTSKDHISLCVPDTVCSSITEGTEYTPTFGEEYVVKGFKFTTTTESKCIHGG